MKELKGQHNMTLDEEVVKKAKEKIKSNGGKLSGLVEYLLVKFNKGEID